MKTLALVPALLFALCLRTAAAADGAQDTDKPFEPISGQAGKDVVWVPTPPVLVEKMLDLAKVTPADFVMDLGSGDGRNIIAAAKRGARAVGVEYNPDMVKLSERIAAKEGVAGKAKFVEGDMYEADISQATVLAMFLLPENLDRLLPKFLDLKPGSRIVLNTFGITGWGADRVERAGGDCGQWCEALLYIVPAKVGGQWKLPQGMLTLEQKFQVLSGSLDAGGKRIEIADGRMDGDRIRFTAGGVEYTGRVRDDTIEGNATSGATQSWTATRQR
jgi:SAM-dependent methyltransferase